MRIVFLGINKIGTLVHDWLIDQGEAIVALLTRKSELTIIPKLKPDLIICGGFRHIIPQEYIAVLRFGCINMHKSLLPLNRGANPNFWCIFNGTPAGVSIHYVDSGIDTGPILAQREVPAKFTDNAKTLYKKLEKAQFELFKEFWPKFKEGTMDPKPQRDKGTYHKIDDFKILRKIDPEQKYKAIDLINLLRAMTFPPFNNCYIEVDGKNYFIKLEINEGQLNADKKDESSLVKQYGD